MSAEEPELSNLVGDLQEFRHACFCSGFLAYIPAFSAMVHPLRILIYVQNLPAKE
jgi:hypothetical protein